MMGYQQEVETIKRLTFRRTSIGWREGSQVINAQKAQV